MFLTSINDIESEDLPKLANADIAVTGMDQVMKRPNISEYTANCREYFSKSLLANQAQSISSTAELFL